MYRVVYLIIHGTSILLGAMISFIRKGVLLVYWLIGHSLFLISFKDIINLLD